MYKYGEGDSIFADWLVEEAAAITKVKNYSDCSPDLYLGTTLDICRFCYSFYISCAFVADFTYTVLLDYCGIGNFGCGSVRFYFGVLLSAYIFYIFCPLGYRSVSYRIRYCDNCGRSYDFRQNISTPFQRNY